VNTLGHTPVGLIQTDKSTDRKTEKVVEPEKAAVEYEHVIVVIDDNPSDLRLARKMLQTGDYNVIEASNGRDGLKAIYNYHPDLVVLDLMLPDVDGYSIIQILQNDNNLQDIPVVVVSAKQIDPQERIRHQENIRSILEKASLDRKQFLDIIKKELS